jgi:hypothetical protein
VVLLGGPADADWSTARVVAVFFQFYWEVFVSSVFGFNRIDSSKKKKKGNNQQHIYIYGTGVQHQTLQPLII